jgi:hypothetical protein
MAEAFVVIGEIGEYSDRVVWTVTALTDEDAAKAFVEEVTRQGAAAKAEWNRLEDADEEPRAWDPIPDDHPIRALVPLDPKLLEPDSPNGMRRIEIRLGGDGPLYSLQRVPLAWTPEQIENAELTVEAILEPYHQYLTPGILAEGIVGSVLGLEGYRDSDA